MPIRENVAVSSASKQTQTQTLCFTCAFQRTPALHLLFPTSHINSTWLLREPPALPCRWGMPLPLSSATATPFCFPQVLLYLSLLSSPFLDFHFSFRLADEKVARKKKKSKILRISNFFLVAENRLLNFNYLSLVSFFSFLDLYAKLRGGLLV